VFFRLVGGAGDIKLTKDGNTLLKEMVCSFFLWFSRSGFFVIKGRVRVLCFFFFFKVSLP
jgi:hypothetical protein